MVRAYWTIQLYIKVYKSFKPAYLSLSLVERTTAVCRIRLFDHKNQQT